MPPPKTPPRVINNLPVPDFGSEVNTPAAIPEKQTPAEIPARKAAPSAVNGTPPTAPAPEVRLREPLPEARKPIVTPPPRKAPPTIINPVPEAKAPEPTRETRKPIDGIPADLDSTILEKFELTPRSRKPEPPAEETTPIDFQFVNRQDVGKIIKPYEPEMPPRPVPSNGPVPPPPEAAPQKTPPASPLPSNDAVVESVTANAAKLIAANQSKKPKLAIIGRVGQQVGSMLLAILGPESRTKKVESATFQHLEIGERRVGDLQFEILGLSMEQQFTRLLDTVARDLVGYIVIVEAHRKEDLDYLNYLLSTLKALYRQPMGIAVVKSSSEKNLGADTLRDLLGAEATDYVRECDPSEVSSIIEFWAGFCAEENLRRWAPSEKTGSF
jgi:signal recognition particle receptor subunit beta